MTPRQDTTMPLANDTQAEIDLLAGTAQLRTELESVKHQRDTWQRMAETAARSVQDLTATRDMLREENDRLVPDAVQAHARNDELCREHMQLRRQIADLTAARDTLQQQVRELLATPRALRVVCPNCREATPPVAATKSLAPFPLRALRADDGIVR